MADLESIDMLIKRKNDIIYLDSRRNEMKNKYQKVLYEFGFEDIYVKPGNWYVFKGKQYFEVNSLELFFWDHDFGYRFDISRGGRTDWNDINKCLDTNQFILICDKMLEFVSNPEILKVSNLKEQLVFYLESNEYTVINVLRFSNENYAWIQVEKDGFFFTYRFERIDLKQDVLVSLEDAIDEDDEPINDKFQKYLDDINEDFESFIVDSLGKYSWKCKVDSDLGRIEIRNNRIMHEILTYGDNLSDPCIVREIQVIMGHILKNEDLFEAFQKDHFHLYKNPNEYNSFFAYKEWGKFEIKIDIDKVFEYRKLFAKFGDSSWMIDFDCMDGHTFEHFCAKILTENGFKSVSVTQGSGDQGIDIIAHKDGIKYGIQCKCYSSDIGNKAVQEVFAGKTFYECHVGVVLTNQHFTSSAVKLASKNGIILWDREKLIDLIKKTISNN